VFCIRTLISAGSASRSPSPAQHHRMPGISLQSPGQRRQIAGAQTAAGPTRKRRRSPAQRPMLGQRIALAVEAPVIELPMHRPQAQRHHPALPHRRGLVQVPVQRHANREQEAVRQAHNLSRCRVWPSVSWRNTSACRAAPVRCCVGHSA
jgi:hypothetical protein